MATNAPVMFFWFTQPALDIRFEVLGSCAPPRCPSPWRFSFSPCSSYRLRGEFGRGRS
ncbi:hypothetical protein R3I93_008592 [Phoxinus phoxinus]|uniref:Uncharacterized protein n=1 Tax=Phoxinus phoxinus TaxID=58324 RepID=A0AAN9H6S5_9TELE